MLGYGKSTPVWNVETWEKRKHGGNNPNPWIEPFSIPAFCLTSEFTSEVYTHKFTGEASWKQFDLLELRTKQKVFSLGEYGTHHSSSLLGFEFYASGTDRLNTLRLRATPIELFRAL